MWVRALQSWQMKPNLQNMMILLNYCNLEEKGRHPHVIFFIFSFSIQNSIQMFCSLKQPVEEFFKTIVEKVN